MFFKIAIHGFADGIQGRSRRISLVFELFNIQIFRGYIIVRSTTSLVELLKKCVMQP
jgi:hypothetical protein